MAVNLAVLLSYHSAQAGSLWRESVTDERGMFADKRARRVGDILTLVVSEKISSSDDLNMTSIRSAAGTKPGLASNLINQFIAGVSPRSSQKNAEGTPISPPDGSRGFPGNLLPRNQADVASYLDPANASLLVPGNRDKQTQVLVLNTQLAVQVIDVLPNGNMVVEGIRQVTFSQQKAFASIRGIVRAMDVTVQNTVPSSLLADARIDIVPDGPNANTFRKGWLHKLDEKISPW